MLQIIKIILKNILKMSETKILIPSTSINHQKVTFEKETLDNSNISENSTSCIEEIQNEEEEIENINKKRNCKLSGKIAETIEKLIENNKKNKRRKISRDCFTGKTLPKICFKEYLNRIIAYTEIEKNTLISSLIYIDEIDKKKPITEFNIHRIMFIAILISIKYNEDNVFKNDYYAKIAGVNLNEINKMEFEFINLLNFNVYIDPDVFENYKKLIEI